MPQDAAKLAGVQQLQDALGYAHGGVAGIAASGEGIRVQSGRNIDARHGLVGPGGELADHLVELRCLRLCHGNACMERMAILSLFQYP